MPSGGTRSVTVCVVSQDLQLQYNYTQKFISDALEVNITGILFFDCAAKSQCSSGMSLAPFVMKKEKASAFFAQ